MDFSHFDYSKNRAIYSECQAIKCPNLEIQFLEEFLKRDYSVFFITTNNPCSKIKSSFGKLSNHPKLFFLDCVSSKIGKTPKSSENIHFIKDPTLSRISLCIDLAWKKTSGKKMLFFDCAELLFMENSEKEVFSFVHLTIQKLQKDGIVIFCFLHDTSDKMTQTKLQHLFDETIFL